MSERRDVLVARLVLAAAASLLVAVLGAGILGEYEFDGAYPILAGLLFGYLVAEVAASLARRTGWAVGAWSALVAAGGLLWAGRIDSDFGVEPLKGLVWVAAALGASSAFVRGVGWRRIRSAVRSEEPLGHE